MSSPAPCSLDDERFDALADAFLRLARKFGHWEAEAAAEALIEHARAQADELKRTKDLLAADLSVLRLGPSDLGFNLDVSGRAVAVLAGHMSAWLREHGAENYTETRFTNAETPFVVTVQRINGKTPHELRLEAEARAERMARLLKPALAMLPYGEIADEIEAEVAALEGANIVS